MVRRLALVLAICISVAGATTLDAKGSGSRGSRGSSTKGTHVKGTKTDGTNHTKAANKPATTKRQSSVRPATAVARDSQGRIQRSDAARHAFARQTGYPNGRPGYVIDHVIPLACGGADNPSNMQWQTIAGAKAKDRTERIGCH
jgi:hypothetical protein